MATSTSDMPLSGGHPVLDFANTVDSRRGRWGPDFLRSFDDLLVLAERTAVLDSAAISRLRKKASADPDRARKAVDEAVTLREAVYKAFIAEGTGRAYRSAALKVVETAAREGRSRERLLHTKRWFAWSLPFDELEDVSRAFALAALELLIARNDRRECESVRATTAVGSSSTIPMAAIGCGAQTPVAAHGAGSRASGHNLSGKSRSFESADVSIAAVDRHVTVADHD
jgi:hypothetical protein